MNSKMDAILSAFERSQNVSYLNTAISSDLPSENANHTNVTSGERSGEDATECVDKLVATPCVGPDFDTLSLQPGQQERRNLLGLSEDEHSNSDSCVLVPPEEGCGERFIKYSSASKAQLLTDLFGEDAVTSQKSMTGIELDDSQINVLKESWRSSDPSKISAYRDAYKSAFQ